jgi:addiction module HigA family antidote
MTNDHLMPPVHPGEVLAQEYLAPLGVTQHHLAVEIGLPPRRINEIVHGKRGISAGTALRLARFFGTSEWFWLNLQSRHDLGRMKDRLAGEPDRTRPLSAWARINPGSPASRTPSPAAPRSCSPARGRQAENWLHWLRFNWPARSGSGPVDQLAGQPRPCVGDMMGDPTTDLERARRERAAAMDEMVRASEDCGFYDLPTDVPFERLPVDREKDV